MTNKEEKLLPMKLMDYNSNIYWKDGDKEVDVKPLHGGYRTVVGRQNGELHIPCSFANIIEDRLNLIKESLAPVFEVVPNIVYSGVLNSELSEDGEHIFILEDVYVKDDPGMTWKYRNALIYHTTMSYVQHNDVIFRTEPRIVKNEEELRDLYQENENLDLVGLQSMDSVYCPGEYNKEVQWVNRETLFDRQADNNC